MRQNLISSTIEELQLQPKPHAKLKQEVGAFLIRLCKEDFYPLSYREWHVGLKAKEKGLVNYVAPTENSRDYYVLSGRGRELVDTAGEKKLLKGKYLLPNELDWYDKFPWKLLLPAAVSIVVAILTSFATTRYFKPPASH